MADLAMGFDFGSSKIGVSIGQGLTSTATALTIIRAQDGIPDWDALDKLVSEWQPKVFVVGLPLNMDDTMSDMAKAATRFSRRLNGRYHIRAEMMDERLSTFEAKEFSGQVDAIAAKLILETWLNREETFD
jgi:putative Holliday junction resolvase